MSRQRLTHDHDLFPPGHKTQGAIPVANAKGIPKVPNPEMLDIHRKCMKVCHQCVATLFGGLGVLPQVLLCEACPALLLIELGSQSCREGMSGTLW